MQAEVRTSNYRQSLQSSPISYATAPGSLPTGSSLELVYKKFNISGVIKFVTLQSIPYTLISNVHSTLHQLIAQN